MTKASDARHPIPLRVINPGDHEVIRSAISMAVSSGSKEWLGLIDLEQGTNRLFRGEIPSFIVAETYLLVAAPTTPWYAGDQTTVLAEHIVIKVYDGPGKFQDVIQALHAMARHWNCRGICVGTALAPIDNALARMYERHGFSKQAFELFKEI